MNIFFGQRQSPSRKALKQTLGYRFKSQQLLEKALTHPSFSTQENYERLEFLGDAILSAILTETLFQLFPNMPEGELTTYKSSLVNGKFLAKLAESLDIRPWIRFSTQASGGPMGPSVLEDVLEALVGAIFLEAGFKATKRVVLAWFGDIKSHVELAIQEYNPKGRIQEYAQSQTPAWSVDYRLVKEEGEGLQKVFEIELWLEGKLYGHASSHSKKRAQEAAAKEAVQKLF
ncbi:MAG: ribonuclease III [Puniceicoccales bacterium]|jgi:ribonuclease-3|nr:ribonuclease III [Puniceicoccales bacterium]